MRWRSESVRGAWRWRAREAGVGIVDGASRFIFESFTPAASPSENPSNPAPRSHYAATLPAPAPTGPKSDLKSLKITASPPRP